MRIAGIRNTSLHDGIGVNLVIFFQGCSHKCKGCQNPETWSKDGGYEVPIDRVIKQIEENMGLISGVTFSGGDPVQQSDAVYEIAKWCKRHGLTTTLYTGYKMCDLHKVWYDQNQKRWRLISYRPYIDYIIDGKFEESKKEDLPFRGSSNQNIWKNDGMGNFYMT